MLESRERIFYAGFIVAGLLISRGFLPAVFAATSPANTPLAIIKIGSTPDATISPVMVGFSHEWGTQRSRMGIPGQPNRIYENLIQNLLAYGAGPFIIRIGGDSADLTQTPSQDSSSDIAPLAQLARDMNNRVKFTLSVNLGQNNVQLAIQQATYFVTNMPAGSIEAVEIGNEPDEYYRNGDRSSTYTFAEYLVDFAKWRSSIMPLLPAGVKLMAPAWAFAASLPNLPAFLGQEKKNLNDVSQHFGNSSLNTLAVSDFFLQPAEAVKGANEMAKWVPYAHQDGIKFRLGETVASGGGGPCPISPCPSGTFSAALWMVDNLFNEANVGVDGTNWHFGDDVPEILQFNSPTTKSDGTLVFSLQAVDPQYYGLLLFEQATANGAKLLPTTLLTSANVSAWATVDQSGVTRVVILNKDESQSGTVTLNKPGGGNGILTMLSAPNLSSTSGITLAGQTFDGSTDGKILGSFQAHTIIPQAGSYTFTLGMVQGALLTISPAAAFPITTTPPVPLANIRVYPNPWRADRNTNPLITFDQLPTNATIKIFTVSGHKIKELNGSNGSVPWDLTNDSGDKVGSGLYLYVTKDSQGNQTRGKLAIIR